MAVTGQTTGQYALSVIEVDPSHAFRYTEERDRKQCAGAGYLRPSQSAKGYTAQANDSDSYFVRLEAGTTYDIEILLQVDTGQSNLIHPDGTTTAANTRTTRDHGFLHYWDVTPDPTGYYSIRHQAQGNQSDPYYVSVTPEDDATLPVVNLHTQGATRINEGDDFSFEAEIENALEHDLEVQFALSAEENYPKFDGGPRQSTTITAGQTTQLVTISTLDDDVHPGASTVFTATIVPSEEYTIGHEPDPQARVTDGSYVPERDEQNMLTGNTVFDSMDDAVHVAWEGCTPGNSYARMTVSEADGSVPVFLNSVSSYATYDYSAGLLVYEGDPTAEGNSRASPTHDFNQPGVLWIRAHDRQGFTDVQIIDDSQLEEEEYFYLEAWFSSLDTHHFVDCGRLIVAIEDNDTAQTGIEAASDTVDEGDDITINLSPNPRISNCDVPFPFYMEITPSGDTAELANAAARTVRIPPCNNEVAGTFATTNTDEDYLPPRQVTFTVTRVGTAEDFSTTDERLLLPQDPTTVTINDNDSPPRTYFEADHITVDANEGDTVTLEVVLGTIPAYPIDIEVALSRGNTHPKVAGGLETRSLHFPIGVDRKSFNIQIVDDDLLNDTVPIRATILNNPHIRLAEGFRTATINVRDGSYVDELDADGNPTGTTVFDPNDDAIIVSWNHCRGRANRATLTVREDAKDVQLQLYLYNGTASAIQHSWSIIYNDRTATAGNDYNAGTLNVAFQPGQLVATVTVNIADLPQLEDTESFVMSLFHNGSLEDEQYDHRCGVIEIFIEDDDTTQIGITAQASQVDEGDDISLTIRPTEVNALANCHVPFPVYYEVTPTGDTTGLVDSNPQVVQGPDCNAATATFATADDSSVTANLSIIFTVTRIGTAADFSTTDERLLAPTSGVTVTVEEDDS